MSEEEGPIIPTEHGPEGYEDNMWFNVLMLAGIPFAVLGCVINGLDINMCLSDAAITLIAMTGGCAEYAVPADAPCGEKSDAGMAAVVSGNKQKIDKLAKSLDPLLKKVDDKRIQCGGELPPVPSTMKTCDAWDAPADARLQTKSARLNFNIEAGEKAGTTLQATQQPPYGAKFNEMYAIAEAKYFKQSHFEKWKKYQEAGARELRGYVRGGIKMKSEAAALEVIAKVQPYVNAFFDAEEGEALEAFKMVGMGQLHLGASKDGFLQAGACFLQPEKLILDTLKLESLKDLAGYKEIWVLMEDLDQKVTAEAQIVTTPFELVGEGQNNSLMSEINRGWGAGVIVYHLKKLDYLIDKAKAKASANNLLDEFEKVTSSMTANLNIIRPGLLLGFMNRWDFNLRDWEQILNPESSEGQANFIKVAKMNLWDILTHEGWGPLYCLEWDCMGMEGRKAEDKNMLWGGDGFTPDKWIDWIKKTEACTKDWPEQAKKDLDNMLDGALLAYHNLHPDDFEISAEAMVTLTGYSYATFKTKGVKGALKRMEKYTPWPSAYPEIQGEMATVVCDALKEIYYT